MPSAALLQHAKIIDTLLKTLSDFEMQFGVVTQNKQLLVHKKYYYYVLVIKFRLKTSLLKVCVTLTVFAVKL